MTSGQTLVTRTEVVDGETKVVTRLGEDFMRSNFKVVQKPIFMEEQLPPIPEIEAENQESDAVQKYLDKEITNMFQNYDQIVEESKIVKNKRRTREKLQTVGQQDYL